MQCFNHPQEDAIGTCKLCQKGICHQCTTDLDHSIACKGKHETQAQALHDLLVRSLSMQGTARKAKYVVPLFYSFMGAVFLIFGIQDDVWVSSVSFYIGLGFLVFALVTFVLNKRAYGASKL